jgi:D-cysteine desulfhydrase
MNLGRFKRRIYTPYYTPIQELKRFSEALGGPKVFAKRDDLLGLSGGGNKTRKLEFLVADALDKGADTLVTCGAVQSNHCRLTLAAAVKEGLKCRLVLEERIPGSYDPNASGNNFLFRMLGVEAITVVPGGSDMMAEMKKIAREVESLGRQAYIVPGGGSNEIGSLGYVQCAQELQQQMFDYGMDFDYIVVPSGSGGTHAGFLVGVYGNNMNIPVLGVSVSRSTDVQIEKLYPLIKSVATHVGCPIPPMEKVIVYDEYVGEGYGRPTDGMKEAVQLLAQTEAILLDTVYTGKQMAGLIDLVRKGFFKPTDKVLFLHTGGAPSLYHYSKSVLPD